MVTWKTRSIGTKTFTNAVVQKQGGSLIQDPGDYAYYAGPVKVTAPGTCIMWGGDATAAAGGFFSLFRSEWSHCL